MRTNANITIYHKGTDKATRMPSYSRRTVAGVLWEACKSANVIKSGMVDSDAFQVYAPYVRMAGVAVAAGDVVVRGLCDREIASDFPIAKLLETHEGFVVTTVDKKDYGSPALWHYEIGGK